MCVYTHIQYIYFKNGILSFVAHTCTWRTVCLMKRQMEKDKYYMISLGFPRWLSGKEPTYLPMQETQEIQVQSLGWEDPLEKGMATHSSILA